MGQRDDPAASTRNAGAAEWTPSAGAAMSGGSPDAGRSPRKASLDVVQGVRGIAALAVVLWHASRYIGPYGTGTGGLLFYPGASMGVDMFFVISGFIMFYTTSTSDGSRMAVLEFAVKRVTRVWPLWIIAVALYVVVLHPASFAEAAKRRWLVNSLLFLPTAEAPEAGPPEYGLPVLGVGWTLNYEMYFYLFFGAAIACGRWRWHAFLSWLFATLVLLPWATGRFAVTPLWENMLAPVNGYPYDVGYLGLMSNPLILLFGAGVALGWLYHSRFAIRDRRVLASVVVCAIAGTAAQYATHFRTVHGLFNCGLSVVPLLFALLMLDKERSVHLPRWIMYLGNVSFSLYLFHPFVQESFDPLARVLSLDIVATGWSAIVATTALSILVAAAAHRWFERALCGALRRRIWQALGRLEASRPRAAG
jgi:peptidoglycan/LPS O-acetylase OafA/YrhL